MLNILLIILCSLGVVLFSLTFIAAFDVALFDKDRHFGERIAATWVGVGMAIAVIAVLKFIGGMM